MPGLRKATVHTRWAASGCYFIYAAAIAVFLVADLAIRPIWTDEAFTFYQVSNRSLAGLFRSFDAGVNALPYAYFLVLWAADQLVGLDPLTLRLPSAMFALMSLILLHRLLAQPCGHLNALLACVAALLLAPDFVLYSHEARPYALYLLAAALCLQSGLCMVNAEAPSRRTLFANGLAAFLLPAVHYAGIFYSAATAVAVLATLRFGKRTGARSVLASFAIGWSLFAIMQFSQIALFLGNKGAIDPAWMARPQPYEVFESALRAAALLPSPVPLMLLFAVGASLYAHGSVQLRMPEAAGRPQALFLLLVSLIWIAMPPFFLLLGTAGLHNLVLPRYFAPSLLAGAILSCLAMAVLTPVRRHDADRPRNVDSRLVETAGFVLVVACLLYPLSAAVRGAYKAPHAISRLTIERDYRLIANAQLPCVTNNIHVFFQYHFYRGERQLLSLLRDSRPGAAQLQRLDERLPIVSELAMGRLERFLYVHQPGTINSYPSFDIQAWAVANHYALAPVATDRALTVFELHRRQQS